jgi:hypothetical protein
MRGTKFTGSLKDIYWGEGSGGMRGQKLEMTACQGKATPDERVCEQCVGIEERVVRDVITAKVEEPWEKNYGDYLRLFSIAAGNSDTFAPLFALASRLLAGACSICLRMFFHPFGGL